MELLKIINQRPDPTFRLQPPGMQLVQRLGELAVFKAVGTDDQGMHIKPPGPNKDVYGAVSVLHRCGRR